VQGCRDQWIKAPVVDADGFLRKELAGKFLYIGTERIRNEKKKI
jgi:hypothetical protein